MSGMKASPVHSCIDVYTLRPLQKETI